MLVTSDTPRPRVEIYSHHFTVKNVQGGVKRACEELSRPLIEWDMMRVPGPGRAKFVRMPKKIYATSTADRREFRASINLLDQFKQHLAASNVPLDSVEFVEKPLYEPVSAPMTWKSPKVPREKQVAPIEYFSESTDNGNRSRVITAPTGSGKGLMSVQALVRHGVRTAIVVKPKYISKWEEELDEFLDLKKEDIMIVQGTSAFVSVMNLALAGELKAKILIFSNKCFQVYFKSYELGAYFNETYPIHPEELYEKLGVGIRLIDEAHEDFHLNFKQDMYTHIPLTMSLSATIDSDAELMNRMYRLLWPVATRGPEIETKPYIAASCLWFRAEKPDRIRHKNAKKQYSHIEFENSIMRDKRMLENYLKIPELVVRTKYAAHRVPGQKMLIFCSTVAMCTLVTERLSTLFPEFTVARYVGEDEWEQLHSNDIVVTTIQSAGTAVDIANLRYTLLTVALSSKQTNIQVVGRLREMVNFPDTTPEFMFTACSNIGKHVEYAMAKKDKLHGKVKTFNQAYLPITV